MLYRHFERLLHSRGLLSVRHSFGTLVAAWEAAAGAPLISCEAASQAANELDASRQQLQLGGEVTALPC